MNCNVLKTGSDGNCVILDDRIVIDMGVTYKTIAPYVKDLQLIILTHVHS